MKRKQLLDKNFFQKTFTELQESYVTSNYGGYAFATSFNKLNNYIQNFPKNISTNHIFEYKSLAKNFFKAGKITNIDLKQVKQSCKIAKFKKQIIEFSESLGSNLISNETIFVMFDTLKQASKKNYFLLFSSTELKEVSNLVSRMYSSVSRDLALNESQLAFGIKKLSSEYLSKDFAHNDFLVAQDFEVNIKPITESFSVKNISFTAKYNKKAFEDGVLKLANNHIRELYINEESYGLNGSVSIDLDYSDGHKDFEYLYDKKQALLLEIEITDTFSFLKKGSKKENHSRKSKFVAVANTTSMSNVQKNVSTNIYSKENGCQNIKTLNLEFTDPLKALWSMHSPTYIDFKKSIDDILADNFYFDGLFKLDTSKCKSIAENLPQVFISCDGRSFYDFFMEQMVEKNCVVKYSSLGDTPTYYIADSIDKDFKKPFENSQDNVDQKFHRYDISSLLSQSLSENSCNNYSKRTQIIPDISYINSKKQEVDDSCGEKPFNSISQTNIHLVNYLQIDPASEVQALTKNYKLTLKSMVGLPFVNSELDFSELKSSNEALSSVIKSFYLVTRELSFKRSKYCTFHLSRKLDRLYYKTDSEQDSYEKVTHTEQLNLTHDNKVKYSYGDYNEQKPTYPKYLACNGFDMVGKVIIGKNVDDDFKKAYRFFKGHKLEESDFTDVQEDQEKGTFTLLNSKHAIFYAIKLPEEVLAENCSEDPVIYIPVKININSSINEFMPLRNDDLIRLKVRSLTNCVGEELVSNSAISIEKTQKQLLQRHLLGAKENCEVAYTEEEKDEIYSIVQQNKSNDNSIFIHNNKGIFITYKAKED